MERSVLLGDRQGSTPVGGRNDRRPNADEWDEDHAGRQRVYTGQSGFVAQSAEPVESAGRAGARTESLTFDERRAAMEVYSYAINSMVV